MDLGVNRGLNLGVPLGTGVLASGVSLIGRSGFMAWRQGVGHA